MMRIYLVIAALLISNPGLAEMYKWKDANGKTHYSDQAPPKADQATKVRPQGGPATPAGTGPKTVAEKEADLRKAQQSKKEQDAQKEAEKAQAEINQKNCAAAQKNLRNMKSGRRISEVDEKGEQAILDSKQVAERVTEAENDVARYCKE